MRDGKPNSFTIGYHPGHGTVVEIRDVGGVLTAELPGGNTVCKERAAEVLNAIISDGDVIVREVGK